MRPRCSLPSSDVLDTIFRDSKTGIALRVRLTPRAAVDRVDGVKLASDGSAHLVARVRAVADKGQANAALERLVAQWVGVSVSSVAVASGATQRLKVLSIDGDAEVLRQRVEHLLGNGLNAPLG